MKGRVIHLANLSDVSIHVLYIVPLIVNISFEVNRSLISTRGSSSCTRLGTLLVFVGGRSEGAESDCRTG